MEMAGAMIGMFYGYSFRGILYHFREGSIRSTRRFAPASA